MRISILRDRHAFVIHHVALGMLVALPLVRFSPAADPYQPVRAVVLGCAGILVALSALDVAVPQGRPARLATVALGMATLLTLASAAAGGLPSAVFGVHGRFQGIASGLAALVALGVGLASARRVRALARMAAVVVVAEAAIILGQRLAGYAALGTTGNGTLTGGWLAVGIALAAAAARAERGPIARALWTAAGTGVLALGALGSRGAWVGLALGVLPVVFARGTRLRLAAAAVLVVVLVAGAAIGGAASLGKLDPAALSGGSAAARSAIWRGAFEMIANAPLLGAGPGRFLYAFAPNQPVEHARLEIGVRPDQAHSVLFQTAAESGVPAALAALVFLAAVIVVAARRARGGDAASLIVLCGLIAWSGQALFGISTIETDALAFALAGIALARTARAVGPVVGRTVTDTAPTGSDSQVIGVIARVVLGLGGVVLAVACAWYLSADMLHLRGVTAFAAGDMADAWVFGRRAVERDPLVDVYRVGVSDAALYGAGSPVQALALIEDGLRLEPASYDLALARARLLGRTERAPAEVLEAYLDALARYPLGIDVGHEAIFAARAADNDAVARTVAEDMLVAYPDDEIALSALGELRGAP